LKIKKLKVALFYDWLNQWGGAEKVLLDLIKLYPQAPVYTLVHNPKKTNWLPKNTKIITSFINRLPFSHNNSLLYTPLYPLALEQFNFSDFDIIISTSSTIGYNLLTPANSLFVCYLHNVNRHIYQQKYLFPLTKIISRYKKTDLIYINRPDHLFCNSKTVQDRIFNTYHQSAKIIYPGIDTSFFIPSTTKSNEKYFLTVSRLVNHKKINLAIKSCHQLKQKLYIVGTGRHQNKLAALIKSLNNPNIKLLGSVNQSKLLSLYQNCQALICPQLEDFGLTPIEAQACGKPVIAYNKGGLTETVINGKTGILFNHQSVKSLSLAISKFNPNNFSPKLCRSNALKFSNKNFMLNFKKEIDSLWQIHQ